MPFLSTHLERLFRALKKILPIDRYFIWWNSNLFTDLLKDSVFFTALTPSTIGDFLQLYFMVFGIWCLLNLTDGLNLEIGTKYWVGCVGGGKIFVELLCMVCREVLILKRLKE